MKTMSARDAKNSFGSFLDAAQREPVVVTKHDRPVTVTLPINDVNSILELADSLRAEITAGVKQGLKEADAGLGRVLDDAYIEELVAEARQRVSRVNTNNDA